jgi:hypothetical protein
MKKNKSEAIEKMKEAVCAYPVLGEDGKVKMCGCKSQMHCALPMLEDLGGGVIRPAKNGMSMTLPFCDKHAPYILTGMFGIMTKDNQPVGLHGPVNEIDLMKSILNAMAMSGELKELLDVVNKVK